MERVEEQEVEAQQIGSNRVLAENRYNTTQLGRSM